MELAELIGKIKRGDRLAFDKFCKDRYPMLISYARLFLKDEWAEDIVQDVFFSVWKNRANLDASSSVRGYLLKSVYNRSINYIKRNSRSDNVRGVEEMEIAMMKTLSADPDSNPVIKKLYDGDLLANINAAIESLPPKCRRVFKMSYLEDMSNKEISASLGISVSTVENHIYSALKQLRATLSVDLLVSMAIFLPFFDEFM